MLKRNLWTVTMVMFLAMGIGVTKDHLYLSPEGNEHAFFTDESFFITCFADKASGATRLTWQAPSGQDITVTEGRIYVGPVPHNPHALELVVEEVRRNDAGVYYCTAIVDGREVTTFFRLLVYRSITFSHTPPVQLAPEGSNFTVFCNVKADPRPTLSWHFRGQRLSPGVKYQMTEDGLVIHRISKEDSGNYTCRAFVVTPRTSQIKEFFIVVQVQYSPHWKRPHMQKGYCTIGSLAYLTCEAKANPAPSFEWLKDGDVLTNHDVYTAFHDDDKSVLQIKVRNHSVLGDYLCRVSNVLGVKERTIALELGVKPSPPEVSVSSDEPGILNLFLNYPSENLQNPMLLGYRVEYKLSSEPWSEAQVEYFGIANNRYLLRNLGYGMDYVIRVAGKNAVGYGAYSSEVTQRTKRLMAETVRDSGALKVHSNPLFLTLLLLGRYSIG